jgi:hypothetical protein
VQKISTFDLYEATYFTLNGCELETIEGLKANGKVACKLTFRGENLPTLQIQYLNGDAMVNLFQFRRAFGQLNAWVNTTRKKFKNQLKQQKQTATQGGKS